MVNVTRRAFVRTCSTAALLPPTVLLAAAASRTPRLPATLKSPYLFFDAVEASFIEPACELLISEEARDRVPGLEVARYVDRQLAGPWGAGERLYRSGPWQPGAMGPGAAAAASPATVFRSALQAIQCCFDDQGTHFSGLGRAAQQAFLRRLASGAAMLDGVPSTVFFDLLLGMSVEGFFTASPLAHQRSVIAWPLKRFPGAYFRAAGRL